MTAEHSYSVFEFFYDETFEDYPSIGEVDFALVTLPVEGRVVRVNTNWANQEEIINDLRQFHNIDAEQELTRILNDELIQLVDQEFLNALRNI